MMQSIKCLLETQDLSLAELHETLAQMTLFFKTYESQNLTSIDSQKRS